MKSKKLVFFGAVLLCLALGVSAMASSSDILDTSGGSEDTSSTGSEAGNVPAGSSDEESSGVLESPEATEASTVIATPVPSDTATATATATPATTTTAVTAVATTSVSSKAQLFAATAVSYQDLKTVMTSSASASTYARSFSASSSEDTTSYRYFIDTGNGYKFTTLYRLNAITKKINASVVIAASDGGEWVYYGAGGSQGAGTADVTPLTVAKQG